MEVTNYWPPLPCQGQLQVQQVTCGPHPGDNLVMEIEPKYKYKAPQWRRVTCSRIRWRGVHCPLQFHWTSVWLGARQPGKPNMDIRNHLLFIIIWNNAIFDLEYKLTCIGFLRFLRKVLHFPAGAWLDHLNCSKKALAFLLLVFRQSVHRCLGWSFMHDSKCVKMQCMNARHLG